MLLLGSAILGWHLWLNNESETEKPAPLTEMMAEPAGTVVGKPLIGVLPFANVGIDAADEYLADGLTGDLITDLARISGLDVIVRSSVFTYKNQKVNLAEIHRELGVNYVLEGSVRRIG